MICLKAPQYITLNYFSSEFHWVFFENRSPCLLAWLDRFYSCAVNSIQPWILQHIFVSSMLFLSFCFSHMMKLRMWMWKGVKGRNTKEGSEEEFLWFNGTKKWYIWENTYKEAYLLDAKCTWEGGDVQELKLETRVRTRSWSVLYVMLSKDFELHP